MIQPRLWPQIEFVSSGGQESRIWLFSNNLSYADDTTLMAESEEKIKEPLDEVWKKRVKKLA